jgi:hypothetical protein
MSFLDEAQKEELANFLNQSGEVEENNSSEQIEVKEEQADNQDVNKASDSSPEQEQNDGHSVPYSRFKSVIEARNELRNRTSKLERQLEELQTQLTAKQEQPRQKEESYFDQDWSDETSEWDDPVQAQMSQYEKRMFELEVAHEQQRLQREVDYAITRFPDVTKDMLLQAVIDNPSTDVMDIAERYSTFVNGLREQAIAEYTKANPSAPSRPSAPPVISAAGSGLQNRVPGGPERNPKNLDQARSALFDYLKSNWSN